jgi:tetratricopeptide (TPR) repeat protein
MMAGSPIRRINMLYARRYFVAVGLFSAFLTMGCQEVKKTTVADPLVVNESADLQRSTEVELVEQMAYHRLSYKQQLEVLRQFYDSQGNNLKVQWVNQELEALKSVPQRSYLVVAELAGSDLRPTKSIVEADMLYNEGMEYFKQGRGTLKLDIFVDKKKLYLAIDKFKELITTYPESDKIDDAAFQIGEINNYYLKDYRVALMYYQRVWQWDAKTPWPARFAMAKIYDEQMHDRVKAIEYYEQAVKLESYYPNVVVYSQRRLKELSTEVEGK